MRHHVPSNSDEPDLDARDPVGAARRAGSIPEDWAAILAAQDERSLPRREHDAASREAPSAAPPPSDPVRPGLERSLEALMTAVSAANERQARDQASRTAIALESMASWIEQTEERLNETARSSADHQDRMAAALSQALSGLRDRLDSVERHAKAERPSRPDPASEPAIGTIRAEIERLRAGMDRLATREHVAALDRALGEIAREIGREAPNKDLLILAQATAAVYRQIQALSEEIGEGLHGRISGEIDHLKDRIDRLAETGVDRTVVEFLSSQIVDMRHDLTRRAEPGQIERLSEDVTTLGRQIADLRLHQVGRSDFSALRTSLENVCAALNRTIAAQEASDVPAQLDSMSRDLAELASRPVPEPVNLDPVTDQLALLTERMAALPEGRFRPNDALNDMIERLSARVQAVADSQEQSQQPLLERFDRLEEQLRQVGRQTDAVSMAHVLRHIDEKLDRVPPNPVSLDALEEQIASLAERLAQNPDEPLHKILEEATDHLRNVRNDAAGIAERAAKAALRDVQASLPDAADLEALKQGLVELRALQTRADRKTQDTLHAVHSALETLAARFAEHGGAGQPSGPISHALRGASPEQAPSADRLEAAVRRLHAATLSQIDEVAATRADPQPERAMPESAAGTPDGEADLGHVRAGFIAAARRAAQADLSAPAHDAEHEIGVSMFEAPDADDASPASLMERIRQGLQAHRRSLLLGLGLVILATGAAQVVSSGLVPSGLSLTASDTPPRPLSVARTPPAMEATETGSIPTPADRTDLFQPSSLAAGAASAVAPPAPAAAPKFLIDPATVGTLPAGVPDRLRQAAAEGDAGAVYEIASRAADGLDMAQDMGLALRLYERAAQAGLPPAQERLAMLLEKGIGTGRDPRQAAVWYERAAQGGNVRAMHNLATLLASGLNGKPDYAAAIRWYGESAATGFRDSQFNMGVLLARGIGTKQDLAKAYMWLALAAGQGDDDAARKRDELAGRLGAADLKAAQDSVERWRPRAVDPVANEAPAPAGAQSAALD